MLDRQTHNTLLAHRLEVVDGEFDVEGPGHGDQVQHRVGGSPESHNGYYRVLERRARDDVLRLEVLPNVHIFVLDSDAHCKLFVHTNFSIQRKCCSSAILVIAGRGEEAYLKHRRQK